MESEYSSLLDIAQSRGIKYSELIPAIHEAILKVYAASYPDSPQDVTVIVDGQTGAVSLLSKKKDVMPPPFAPQAARIARQIIIKKIKETEEQKIPSPAPPPSVEIVNGLSQLFFWSYHALYLFLAVIYLLNLIFSSSFRLSQIDNLKNLGAFRTTALVFLSLVPLFSVITAFKFKLTKYPKSLAKLLFFLEIPLILILWFAVIVFASATPAVWFFLLVSVVTLLVFFFDIIKVKTSLLWHNFILLTLEQTAATTAAYLTFLFSFFLPLVLGAFSLMLFSGIFEDLFYNLTNSSFAVGDIISLIIFLVLGMLGLLFIALLMITPFLVTYFLFKILRQTHLNLKTQFSPDRLKLLHGILAVSYIILLVIVSYQPDITPYINQLQKLRNSSVFEEKESIAVKLLPQQGKIRRAFTDMLDSRKRYPFSKNDEFLKNGYIDIFHLNPGLGQLIQATFNFWAYPFVYQGPIDRQTEAFQNYEYLFGHPASKSNFNPALPNVRLVSKTVSARTYYRDLLASITIQEEYENTYWGNQEVVYEFSLPEASVITDLKLGPDLEFDGVIAPRGAAGKVYQQELERRRDPALLEQTGPRQYRLRVFPIPARGDMTLSGKNQKVLFTYVTAVTPAGYPLPNISQKRNIRVDRNSEIAYYFNDQPFVSTIDAPFITNAGVATDLCRLYPDIDLQTQTGSASAQIIPHQSIPNLANITCSRNSGLNLTGDLRSARLAILYDVSATNQNNPFLSSLKKTLIENSSLLSENTLDFYRFNDALSRPQPLTLNMMENPDLVYFGKSDWLNAVSRLNPVYDLIIVVTSNHEMTKEIKASTINYSAPVYVIHADDSPPAYPETATRAVLQSGGAIVPSLDQAITHYSLATRLPYEGKGSLVSFTPFWAISVTGLTPPPPDAEFVFADFDYLPTNQDDPLSYLADKAYFMNLVKRYQAFSDKESPLLDSLNAFAGNTRIVTPFSSLIALVNQAQMSDLKRAAGEQDRYSYEASKPQMEFSIPTPPNLRAPSIFDMGIGTDILMMPGSSLDGGDIGMAMPSGSLGGSGISFIIVFALLNGLLLGLGGFIFLVIKIKRKISKNASN